MQYGHFFLLSVDAHFVMGGNLRSPHRHSCPGHNNLEAKHLDRLIDKNHNLLNKLMAKTIIYKSDSWTKSINYKIDSWAHGHILSS